ncbi:RSP_2648 family PIN domain-containing protein [Psychromarinibacter sp. S121]|uniref:RSP_2648 family PIN domain-containing protein n=1 Tax=Psychromarinibacter sp. S121 TaxID=3415127 RepID=UPI003C7AC911
MKVLIDANVLYPTVMRQVVLGVAKAGLFTPLWSARILEEWARAARKLGPEGEAQARAEVALVRRDWPDAEVPVREGLEARLWLPDPADVHVLAAAVTGSADIILTENAQDFPRGVLAEEGVERQAVDPFLMGLFADHPDAVAQAAEAVRQEAERLSGEPWEIRKLLRKARLPRLGKALAARDA